MKTAEFEPKKKKTEKISEEERRKIYDSIEEGEGVTVDEYGNITDEPFFDMSDEEDEIAINIWCRNKY